jgi:L-ascorbate metabolism protein UlaG (beta-lactamase superfamily)
LNILTDPMWSERASPAQFAGPKRWVAPGVALDALPPLDVVLQSHNHYDHLDDHTVRQLVRRHHQAFWLTPLGLASFVRKRGAPASAVIELIGGKSTVDSFGLRPRRRCTSAWRRNRGDVVVRVRADHRQ